MASRKPLLMNMYGTMKDIEIGSILPSKTPIRTGTIAVDDLVDSIRRFGLLHPIVVRSVKDHFEIVAGHRRYLACRKLAWRKISCHIVELDDKSAYEVSIIENLHRKTLSAIEEAHAFRNYISEFGWGGIAELAQNISKSSSYISKRIKLLDLSPDILQLISNSEIYPSVAEEILSVQGNDRQSELAIMVRENDLSLRDTRKLMSNCLNLRTENSYDQSEIFCAMDKEAEIKKYFDKLIISLRFCSRDAAGLIEEAEKKWVLRELLIQHRNMITDQINLLIRQRNKVMKRRFFRLVNR